jgi:Transglutaminase-like superfamily
MRSLSKFLALTREERRLLVKAVVLLTLVRLGLGRVSFASLRRLVTGRRSRGYGSARVDRAMTDLVVWAVDAAGRHVPGRTTCLTRAMTVQAMLARDGHPSRLHVGVVRGQQGRLEAHAWVECDGRIIVGGSPSEIGQFTPLAAFGVEPAEPIFKVSALQTLTGGR